MMLHFVFNGKLASAALILYGIVWSVGIAVRQIPHMFILGFPDHHVALVHVNLQTAQHFSREGKLLLFPFQLFVLLLHGLVHRLASILHTLYILDLFKFLQIFQLFPVIARRAEETDSPVTVAIHTPDERNALNVSHLLQFPETA